MKYFAQIAYNGYGYSGWQKQPKALTVQQVLEERLSQLLGKKTNCMGCGRTDAMVHASQFFCHFETDNHLDDNFIFRLNKLLPNDVAVQDIFVVPKALHAQHSATWRTYNYIIHTQKDPHLSQLSSLYLLNFNLSILNKAVRLIPQNDNFINFCRCPSRQPNTLCNVTEAKLFVRNNGKMIRLQFKSNRFLQGMIRMLVQQLINVGTNQISIDEFEAYLKDTAKPRYNKSAYPQGLYLSGVEYKDLKARTPSVFFDLLNNSDWEEQ